MSSKQSTDGSEDLISIIVPAYNHEQYIDFLIDSLLAQSYNNIELIIINDGSKDNTLQKIKAREEECKAHFSNFILINQENSGIVKALNNAIAKASGKYIAPIASDDSYEPDAIKTLHNFLSANSEYSLAVGDNYIMDDKNQRCFWDSKTNNCYDKKTVTYKTFGECLKSRRNDIDFSSENFGTYQSLLRGNYIPNGYLIRKSTLDQFGGYSSKAPLEDYYLMLQISKRAKLKFIDIPLFNYRWHSLNTIKQRKKMMRINLQTLSMEKSYALKNGYILSFTKNIFMAILKVLYTTIRN